MTARLEIDLQMRLGPLRLEAALEVGAETLVLVGPNGAGKTSLLLGALGLVPPAAGRVAVGGEVVYDGARSICLPPEARQMGYLPQDYALFPHLTARQNVEFALGCLVPTPSRAARRRAAEALLAETGVAHLSDRLPAALSGGERQRVALARALAPAPRALLLDEPFAALDVSTRREVRATLARHLARLGRPAIVVTHDGADARAFGCEIAVLELGRVVQRGRAEALAAAPATPYVARLFRPADD